MTPPMVRRLTSRRFGRVSLVIMTTLVLGALKAYHIASASGRTTRQANVVVVRSCAFLFSSQSRRKRTTMTQEHRIVAFTQPSKKWTRPAIRRTPTTAKAAPIGIAIQEQNNNITATSPVTTIADSSSVMLSTLPPNLQVWLDLSLPEGRCMGVSASNDFFPVGDDNVGDDTKDDSSTIGDKTDGDTHGTVGAASGGRYQWMDSAFHPSEVEYGLTLKKSRASFWLGRLALRLALDFPDYPILRDSYGRPQLSPGIFGSISHKQDRGIALVSPIIVLDEDGCGKRLAGVGIDLELTSRPGRPSVASRVLTERERQALGGLPGISVEEEVLLRFSLKEAIYKAAHPLLCQYVSFQEAEVTPHPDGTASCSWLLHNHADERIAKLTAHWRKVADEGFFLTSASVYERVPV